MNYHNSQQGVREWGESNTRDNLKFFYPQAAKCQIPPLASPPSSSHWELDEGHTHYKENGEFAWKEKKYTLEYKTRDVKLWQIHTIT